MPHDTPLIATIVIGLTLAFALGAIAQRLKISPIAGYLLAGIAVGPYTPGYVADQSLALELAEIGVILLMFGVGLHFSPSDLMSVRAIAIPGALAQIACATALGLGLALLLGWSVPAGLVFGLALSVASTVVLLRALQDRRLLNSQNGRITVGWLIVEDIAMVIALVLLPALAPTLISGANAQADPAAVVTQIAITLGKVIAFAAVMLVVGRRLIPAVLHYIAHTGSRELFRLGVLAIALGVAFGASKLFGVSFALGAFFAGMILSESELSQRAAQESLPLRDAFAVLFFVSVGMLFNPAILITDTWPVTATIAIIVLGKSLAALAIVLAFGHTLPTALFISASLAQIGEFSFILAGLGVTLGLLPETGRDLIMAGALLSILLNPLLFFAIQRFGPRDEHPRIAATPQTQHNPPPAAPAEHEHIEFDGHVALIGYGRVGAKVGEHLLASGERLFVIDEREETVARLREKGISAVTATAPSALNGVDMARAKALVVAIHELFEAGQIVEQARAASPDLIIIARAHSQAEAHYLARCGATAVVEGAAEISQAMVDRYKAQVTSV